MNLLKRFFYHLTLILIMGVVVIAAQAETTSFGINILEYFYNIPALAGVVIILTSLLKTKLKIVPSLSRYVSWIIAISLSTIGWLLHAGIFSGVEWYFIFIYGFASAFIANGLFDWVLVKAILTLLKLEPKDTTVIIGGK